MANLRTINIENRLTEYVKEECSLNSEDGIKPKGYWNDPSNILNEARKVKEKLKLDKLPAKDVLSEKGYSSLACAIVRVYPKGYSGIRKDLGEKILKYPDGYWDEPINIEKEVKKLMKKEHLKKVPSFRKLKELDNEGLGAAITKHYPGGYSGLRTNFGEEEIKKSLGYWKSINNITKVGKEIIQIFGFLPGKGILTKDYASFCAAVVKYHGGFKKIRKLLNEDKLRVDDGYWNDIKNIEKEIKKFKKKEKYDYLPPQKELGELGYSSLSQAITNHYPGGYNGYRKDHQDYTIRQANEKTISMLKLEERLGEDIDNYLKREYMTRSAGNIGKELGYTETTILGWLDFFGIKRRNGPDKVLRKIKSPDKKELIHFYEELKYSRSALKKHYHVSSDVINRWFREHGIITREDQKIDLRTLTKKELEEYAKENYKGLSVSYIHKEFKSDYRYLNESGLMDYLVKKGLINRKKEKNNFWTREKIISVGEKLIKEYGTIPSERVLDELGYGTFRNSIYKYFDGLPEFREFLGVEDKNQFELENLLDNYIKE